MSTIRPVQPEHSSADEHLRAPAEPVPTRTETDSLGSVEVPATAYWGVHTMRALENFPICKRPISVYPDLVVALASVKQAAARANREVGVLTAEKAAWIDEACQRIIDGEHHDQFVRRRHPGRRRHVDEHERERGHREPRARDRAAAPRAATT